MKTSTPQSIRPRTAPSFLFRGPPGGGKTSLAIQFPKLWVADIDLNLNGPEEVIRKKQPTLSYAYDTISLDDDGKAILTAEGLPDHTKIWLRLKVKTNEAILNPDVRTLFLDGLTQLNTLLIQKVMKDNKASEMQQQYWIPFRCAMMELIMKCRHAGKILIMSCHEEAIIARDGTVEGYNVAMSSKLKDVLGGLFTDVWLFNATASTAGTRVFTVKTGGDARRRDIKTSFPSMPVSLDVTANGWDTVNKYMNL